MATFDPKYDLAYCECAGCGKLLVGEKSAAKVRNAFDQWPGDFADPVYTRQGGRPLCEGCGRKPAWWKQREQK